MAIQKIVKHGHPALRKKCKPVTEINKEIRRLIKDMFDTMYAAPGIGLAANQIGVDLSLAVIDIQPNGNRAPIVLINPKIVSTRGMLFEEEGCLSIPGLAAKIQRFARTKAEAIDENGVPMIYEGQGLFSRALQHEIDHLNGKFYIDHIPLIERVPIQAEIRKLKKTKEWQ